MPDALLVSHGQPSDPNVGEAEMAELAQAVAACLPDGWQVRGATLAADGALDQALNAGPEAQIVPVFMTEGWFTQTALPRRLAGRGGAVLSPLGVWPSLAELAADWLRQTTDAQQWQLTDTTVIIAAHGSGRSPYAALDTRIFADRLARTATFAAIRCCFVEQGPYLADTLAQAGSKAVCLPFFAARRGHVLEDLPQAVAQSGFAGVVLDPIGLHGDVPALIARKLTARTETAGNV